MRKEAYQIDTAKTRRPGLTRVIVAAEQLGISRTTLYRRVNDGVFTIIKRGAISYIPTHQIDAYLDPSVDEMVG